MKNAVILIVSSHGIFLSSLLKCSSSVPNNVMRKEAEKVVWNKRSRSELESGRNLVRMKPTDTDKDAAKWQRFGINASAMDVTKCGKLTGGGGNESV